MYNTDFINSSMWHNAKREEVILEIRRFWKAKIQKDPETVRPFLEDHEFKEYLEWKAGNNRQKIGESYALITINPRDPMGPEDIGKFTVRMKKAVKKVWISEWMYCFEWRGGQGGSKGFHAHLRCKIRADKGKSAIIREMFNTFAKWCDTLFCIDVRFSKDPKAFVKYIKGVKGGKKKGNYHNDVSIRKKLGMQDVYAYDDNDVVDIPNLPMPNPPVNI